MEATRVIIDTNIFIEYIRKKNKRKTRLYKIASEHKILTTANTVFELMFGARTTEAIETVENVLEGVPVLEVNKAIAMRAANEQNLLREKNKAVEIRDLFIASIALENDLELATINQKHFIHFPDLKLLDLSKYA